MEFFNTSIQTEFTRQVEWLIEKPFIDPVKYGIIAPEQRGLIFRSQYETEFANWLRRIGGFKFLYEPILFQREYIPDFLIVEKFGVTFIEVKGLWQPGAYAKVKRFVEFLEPYGIPFYVIDKTILKMMGKGQ